MGAFQSEVNSFPTINCILYPSCPRPSPALFLPRTRFRLHRRKFLCSFDLVVSSYAFTRPNSNASIHCAIRCYCSLHQGMEHPSSLLPPNPLLIMYVSGKGRKITDFTNIHHILGPVSLRPHEFTVFEKNTIKKFDHR